MKLTPLFLSFFIVVGEKPSTVDNAGHPGMIYFIVSDKKTSCSDDFPEHFSYFLGQSGGFGDKSEVSQVSRVLKIDLSIFQDVGYNYEGKADIKKHWHRLTTLTSVIDSLIAKIKIHPEYYAQVIHDPDYQTRLERTEKIIISGDTAKFRKAQQEPEKASAYGYPPDLGYLREGKILIDLYQLKATLECFRRNGVTKVRFEYV